MKLETIGHEVLNYLIILAFLGFINVITNHTPSITLLLIIVAYPLLMIGTILINPLVWGFILLGFLIYYSSQ